MIWTNSESSLGLSHMTADLKSILQNVSRSGTLAMRLIGGDTGLFSIFGGEITVQF